VKTIKPYHLLFLLLLSLMMACGKKTMNDRVSLWRNDKIPYGCWYAYNELDYIFPNAEVVVNKLSPDRYRGYTPGDAVTYEDAAKYDDKKSAYMIITGDVVPDEEEVRALLSLAGSGKHVFISCMRMGPILLDSLRLKTAYSDSHYNFHDSLTVSVKNPLTSDSATYSYPGNSMDNFIIEMDENITKVLGRDGYGRPNFVRFDYEGGGSIFVHFAPLAFSNYFLLHNENKTYYDQALSFLPKDLEVVRWDDYFRYHEEGNERNKNNSNSFIAFVKWVSGQHGLSTAFWLLLLLFALIYLFESKRKQRIIPEWPPLNNASLDFVKTIGRLYYQRRDNKNLAQKMTAHFLDHVRSRYNIRLSVNDEEFEKRLAWKAGHDPAAIRDLLYHIKYVQDEYTVTDEALMGLNARLENFYRTNT
jgi:hypothetical protein